MHTPQQQGGECDRDRKERRQRQLLPIGTAGDRVDRRTAERLERQPFAQAFGQDLRCPHRFRRHALEAQWRAQRSTDGERDALDAAEPRPGCPQRPRARRRPDSTVTGVWYVRLARKVAFPEHLNLGVVRHTLDAPGDCRELAASEVGDQRYDDRVRCVTGGDDQCVSIERPGAGGQLQLRGFPALCFRVREPGARHGDHEVCRQCGQERRDQGHAGEHRVATRGQGRRRDGSYRNGGSAHCRRSGRRIVGQ